jgi:DNA repair exonuclease SbcCD ATPase subunit
LIDDLLEELPASKTTPRDPNAREIAMTDVTGSFGPVEKEPNQFAVFEDENSVGGLKLEKSQKVVLDPVAQAQAQAKHEKPPFQGDAPVVTKLSDQRSKIIRTSEVQVVHEERKRPEADIDFGEMSAEDPFESKISTDAPSQPADDERTMRVVQPHTLVSQPAPRPQVPVREKIAESVDRSASIDRAMATEIRPGIKIPPSPKLSAVGGSSSAPTSFEGALRQSESLRIAQTRITDLERELERVRRDNEALSTAGDTLRRRADELASKAENFEIQAREAGLRLDEEKKVLRGQLQSKDRENAEMRARVEEIEARLESNFKKIRVRERELEHRLEIVKIESSTLVTTKDKMLLDLKRQIDQLHQESDSAKSKSQELFSQYKEKQETIRRVVRALRIALTILEGDNETVVPMKKVD